MAVMVFGASFWNYVRKVLILVRSWLLQHLQSQSKQRLNLTGKDIAETSGHTFFFPREAVLKHWYFS